MNDHYLLPCTCKHCNVLKLLTGFDWLNFIYLTGVLYIW